MRALRLVRFIVATAAVAVCGCGSSVGGVPSGADTRDAGGGGGDQTTSDDGGGGDVDSVMTDKRAEWASSGDIVVDWASAVRPIDERAFGVNCTGCFDPNETRLPGYAEALKKATQGGGLIRYHNTGMVKSGTASWLDSKHNWDAKKIHDALAPIIDAGLGPQIMINIPFGINGNGDVKDVPRMAAFTAALVKIVNVDNDFGVHYWEVPNESEEVINVSQVAALVTACSRAMKKVDPTIAVGGPAMKAVDYGQRTYIESFLKTTLADVDFVSGHMYGGDGTQTDAHSFDLMLGSVPNKIAGSLPSLAALRVGVDKTSPSKKIPIFLDEYNISYNFAKTEIDHRGGAYDVVAALGAIHAGANGSAHWSGIAPQHNMSMVDANFKFNDAGLAFALLGEHVRGFEMRTTVASPALFAFAAHGDASHVVVIVNHDSAAHHASLAFLGWSTSSFEAYVLDSAGFAGPTTRQAQDIADDGLDLAAESVILLVAPE